jgi:hypothetical protein
MRRILVLLAVSLLFPTPALMKSRGGGHMGHMEAGAGSATVNAQAYHARA